MTAALRRAEACLRTAASEWADIPGRTRIKLLRCADSAKAMLIRAGNGK